MAKQDELAQRDRKHRDKYTGDNKRHLEGVETSTRTGETDQGVTESFKFLGVHITNKLSWSKHIKKVVKRA